MKETIDKVRKLLKPIIRLSIAFAATAILFQLTTNVKLFNMDVVNNTSKFMNDIGNETVMGLIAISLLLNFLGKKIKLY
ncbi:uncharacterized protein METZ01_LOCUS123843 [marine metagenome]|mgnify:FL=1|jgi:hypothetical protein|uniref:Uncharacterized protein n=1 Tax=marine metagenome TaxID=408172 RepID=A0A381Y1R8_9ZZZZ|tara:strand:- start:1023 stop:1259 length:237 start_codon:yes stop_codon:yes gene_type:complete